MASWTWHRETLWFTRDLSPMKISLTKHFHIFIFIFAMLNEICIWINIFSPTFLAASGVYSNSIQRIYRYIFSGAMMMHTNFSIKLNLQNAFKMKFTPEHFLTVIFIGLFRWLLIFLPRHRYHAFMWKTRDQTAIHPDSFPSSMVHHSTNNITE